LNFYKSLIHPTFYEQDLQKVNVKDDDLLRIEKIVKCKGDEVLVHWKDWPVKYDSWLEKKDVLKAKTWKSFMCK